MIGNRSSEAEVTVGWLNNIACQHNPIFERYHSILPELLGVAQVHIADAIVTEGQVAKGAFYVQAKPAKGSKCERCWRFPEDVGKTPAILPSACAAPKPSKPSTSRPTPQRPHHGAEA